GQDLDARTWRSVYRQLLVNGLLEADIEGYGGLRLTAASRSVLRGECSVQLRKDPSRGQALRNVESAGSPVYVQSEDRPLYEALRAFRTHSAREQNVPAYVIFHDSTLRAIAELCPATLSELAKIGGVGGGKLARYGERVLAIVRQAKNDVS
ncbi:MAG: HRDC domain-containing protein, partial [Xanthomonadaceae bacterium]|nr:HRDC domain-containing protein [Xanthomonadaceae bacterium]